MYVVFCMGESLFLHIGKGKSSKFTPLYEITIAEIAEFAFFVVFLAHYIGKYYNNNT